MDPEWVSSDETFNEFFDRLAESVPGASDFEAFRAQCAARERAGRQTFGVQYLDRRNAIEALEEAADGANYLFFHALQKVKQGRREEDIDSDLMAAYYFYKAWSAAAQAERKDHQAPN